MLGWGGLFRYTGSADAFRAPGSIAVSRDKLVFISDNFKHAIKVYRIRQTTGPSQDTAGGNALLADKAGGEVVAPGGGIAGLSVADDYLFVADSLSTRAKPC